MLKIENTEVMGWEAAIRGMRNPKNSWGKSDSAFFGCIDVTTGDDIARGDYPKYTSPCAVVGPNDLKLMTTLRNAGTDHRKFMRMITVYLDITAPLYWWKEFDTYKVGTVANSCSTMHKIADKEFTIDDFSHEHLLGPDDLNWGGTVPLVTLECVINALNVYRQKYLKTKDKKYWWQMIQLLPSSYNQRRTVMLNYEVLANIYKSRRNHKLDEWVELCKWIESLPYSELITGKEKMMDKCPICNYPLHQCQCLFGGNAHPDRNEERQVVLDHLYLLSEAQLQHVINLEKHWCMSYVDDKRTKILARLRSDKNGYTE